MRGKSVAEKLKFIEHVVNSPVPKKLGIHNTETEAKIQKFYYQTVNKELIRRDWIYSENNKFHCMFCIFFGVVHLRNHKDNISTSGLDYEKRFNVITQKIRRHEITRYHEVSQKMYTSFSDKTNGLDEMNGVRCVVKTILKIIIFLVTHSKYLNLIKQFGKLLS